MIIRLVHLIALSFLIGILFLISISEARGIFTAYGQSMVLSEAKSRECPGPVPEPSMTIITPPCNNKKQSTEIINATSSAGAIVKYNPTLRGEKVSATCLPSSGSMLPIGNNSITCTAIDKQGTMVMQKFVITVAADRTPPRIQVPNHNLIVANATNANGTRINYANSISVTDNVATNIHPICQPIASGHVFPIGNTTIVCTAKDNSNNTAKASFVVVIADRTPPRIQVPNHNLIVANATNARGSVVDYNVSATDNMATNIHPICQPIASGQVFPIGNTTIVCTAKDNSNNTAKASFVVVIADRTPPRIQVPNHNLIVANATNARGSVVDYNVSATDNMATNIHPICQPIASGQVFPIGNTTIVCTAKDNSNNTAKASFVVVIADRTPPRIQVPNHNLIVANATNARGSVVDYNVSATDNMATNIHPICQPIASGQVFPIGNTTIVCTAKDNSNNTAKASFVVVIADRTPPRIQVPNHNLIVANATNARGSVVDYNVSATDNMATNIHPICQPIASGQVFPIGNTTIVCTAKDNSNNTAKASFVVVIADRTPPRIQVPNHNLIVANATNARGSVVDYNVSATDNMATNIHPICQPIASGQVFPIGNTTIVCTAKDNSNNTAKASFVVVIADRTPPRIQVPNHNLIVANATNARGSVVDYNVSATDNMATNIHPICQPIASGQVFPIGNTTIVCTAKDNSNNTAKASFVVVIADRTPPRIQVPNHNLIVANATNARGSVVDYNVTATDNVATNIHPICQPIASGQVFPIGNTTIVCTAKDNSNNTAKASFVVVVKNKEVVSTRSNGLILAIILIIIAGAIAAAIFIYRRSRQEKYSI